MSLSSIWRRIWNTPKPDPETIARIEQLEASLLQLKARLDQPSQTYLPLRRFRLQDPSN
jgi:hypothetical protein